DPFPFLMLLRTIGRGASFAGASVRAWWRCIRPCSTRPAMRVPARSSAAAMSLPVVLLHGYSDKGKSFERWQSALAAAGYDVTQIHTCNYETLTNEASLQDIAEGFDRALRIRAGLDADEPFDAIVHSTGML